jgi:plastocyanin
MKLRTFLTGILLAATLTLASATSIQARLDPPNTHIAMIGYAFEPAEQTITTGESITWQNDGQELHNVFELGGTWESPALSRPDLRVYIQHARNIYLCLLNPLGHAWDDYCYRAAATAQNQSLYRGDSALRPVPSSSTETLANAFRMPGSNEIAECTRQLAADDRRRFHLSPVVTYLKYKSRADVASQLQPRVQAGLSADRAR